MISKKYASIGRTWLVQRRFLRIPVRPGHCFVREGAVMVLKKVLKVILRAEFKRIEGLLLNAEAKKCPYRHSQNRNIWQLFVRLLGPAAEPPAKTQTLVRQLLAVAISQNDRRSSSGSPT